MASGLRLAPGGLPAPIERLPPLEFIAAFLVERDELYAAFADATLTVTAARRQQPPLEPLLLPTCDGPALLWPTSFKMGTRAPRHNRVVCGTRLADRIDTLRRLARSAATSYSHHGEMSPVTRYIIQVDRPGERVDMDTIRALLDAAGVALDPDYGPVSINPKLGRYVVRGVASPDARERAERIPGVRFFADALQEPAS